MIEKTFFLALLGIAGLTAAQTALSSDIPCPPTGDLDSQLAPGKCATSYICVGDGGNITVKSSLEDTGLNCNSVIISLRCSGEHETVEYNEFGGNSNVRCDHALIEFSPEGNIQQRCCHTDGGIVSPDNGAENGQQPLDGGDVSDANNGTTEAQPVMDGNNTQNGTTENGEAGESPPCPGKNNTIPVVIDDQDPNYVWACRCNDGELPERQAISGLYPTDNSGCPTIDLAIQKVENAEYTIFCGKALAAEPARILTVDNSTVRECIGQCSRDENCSAIWWDIVNCVLFSNLTALPEPYLVAGSPAKRSVVAIKGNATALATPTVKDPADNVVLSNPTPIVGNISGSPVNADDEYYQLEIPFPIHIYDKSSTNLFVTVNGVLSLDSGSHSYSRGTLPTTNLPAYSVLGLWSDLYIYQNTPQGIYYEVAGEIGARTITFEWYCSHFHQPDQYYHFTMAFFEGRPGAVTFKYYDVLDKGSQAAVGVQGNQQSIQFSLNQDIIVPGLEINFDTHKANKFTQTTFRI